MTIPISWDERLCRIIGNDDLSEARHGGFLYVKPEANFAPGAACWLHDCDGNISTLVSVCPCGCGSLGHTALRPPNSEGWTWNGNKELPTLRPSILKLTPCRWHGYLTDGVFQSC